MKQSAIVVIVIAWASAVSAQTPAAPPGREQGLDLAAKQIAAGRVDEAADILRQVADRFKSVQALMQLARIQSGRRDAKGAVESLQRALALAPNSEEVLSAFAQLSLGVKLPLPAIATLDSLTRICPTVAQYQYLLGVALMQIGDMSTAVGSLKAAERIEPDRPLTLIALGLALNNRKEYADARTFLLRSLELDPDSAEAVAALAESEEGLGDLASAETHARRALAKSTANAAANLVLGLVFMRRQQYGDARDAFQQSIAADPDSTKALYQLSLACARLGDEACSAKNLELYKQKLRETEERVLRLRTQTGLGVETRR